MVEVGSKLHQIACSREKMQEYIDNGGTEIAEIFYTRGKIEAYKLSKCIERSKACLPHLNYQYNFDDYYDVLESAFHEIDFLENISPETLMNLCVEAIKEHHKELRDSSY